MNGAASDCKVAVFRLRALISVLLVLASCSRAPSFDIVGSFFPAWLICFIVSIGMSALCAVLFRRLQIPVAVPVLTYPCLALLFTFALWLVLFA
jgi:hypothetical protein